MEKISIIAYTIAKVAALTDVGYMVIRFVGFSILTSVSSEVQKFISFKYFVPEEKQLADTKQINSAKKLINIILYCFYILICLAIILTIIAEVYKTTAIVD